MSDAAPGASTPPAPATAQPLSATAISQCPYCDYELAGLAGDRCPECGNQIAEADVRLDARRRVFLDLTRRRVWGWNVVAMVVAVALTLGLGAVAYALSLAAAFLLPKHGQAGLIRRVQRRVWLLSAWWLFAPCALCTAMPFGVDWLYWNTSLLDWLDLYSPFDAYGVMGILEILGPAGAGAFLLLVFLGSVLLWRGRLRVMGKIAGLAREPDPFPWRSAATRLAVYPLGLGLATWTVLNGAVLLLDMYFPEWAAV